MESLTDELEKRIWDMVMDIESKGDPAELSDKGWFKKFFEDCMARYSKQISKGELLKVGVNAFEIPPEEDTLLKDVAEGKIEPFRDRIEWTREYKKNRDQSLIKHVLEDVREKAKAEKENTMYPITAATEAGATMGEIAGVMRMAYDFPYDPYGLVEPPL